MLTKCFEQFKEEMLSKGKKKRHYSNPFHWFTQNFYMYKLT